MYKGELFCIIAGFLEIFLFCRYFNKNVRSYLALKVCTLILTEYLLFLFY